MYATELGPYSSVGGAVSSDVLSSDVVDSVADDVVVASVVDVDSTELDSRVSDVSGAPVVDVLDSGAVDACIVELASVAAVVVSRGADVVMGGARVTALDVAGDEEAVVACELAWAKDEVVAVALPLVVVSPPSILVLEAGSLLSGEQPLSASQLR